MIRQTTELDQAIEDSKGVKMPTRKQIEHWVFVDSEKWFRANSDCSRMHLSWENGSVCTSKLWLKPYDEIVEFLINRFYVTMSETEYYMLMLYLWKHIPTDILFVPFKQSPQYRKGILGEKIYPPGIRGVKGVKQGNIKVRGV